MNRVIDGPLFRLMVLEAARSIEVRKQELNDLNVFPVPDGDTGTNMSLTISAAAAELGKHENENLGKMSEIVAQSLLRGARGNSGVIMSLLFRGIAKQFKGSVDADGALFATALTNGVDTAYKAVMKPAEGTILTVSRKAALAATAAATLDEATGKCKGELSDILASAVNAARVALSETTNQNPVLKKAGVVDAGGAGYLIILEAMQRVYNGEVTDFYTAFDSAPKAKADSAFAEFNTADITFTYCTEFIVLRESGKEQDAKALRRHLEKIGDCVVVVDDEEIIKVHVHTNDPGDAIQRALKFGALDSVKIENMRLQHTEKLISQEEPASEPVFQGEKLPYGFVSVAAGDGLASIFRDLGVNAVVEGGQTMNPSTADILDAVNSVNSDVVYILPNNKNIIMAAEQVIPLTEKTVTVVPTKTVNAGISAMLVFNESATPEENRDAMMEAASAVRTGQVTYAARNSTFDDRDIHEGDYMALVDGKLSHTSTDKDEVLASLADSLVTDDVSFVTVIYGEGVTEEEAQAASAMFEKGNAEVTTVYGGQPVYYYLISAE